MNLHGQKFIHEILHTGKWSILGSTAAVSSKFHPGRACTSCILCDKTGGYVTHYLTWGENEKKFVCFHLGKEPAFDSCICKVDYTDARRHCCDSKYTPKWKRSRQHQSGIQVEPLGVSAHCIYPECSSGNTGLIRPTFECIDNLEVALTL